VAIHNADSIKVYSLLEQFVTQAHIVALGGSLLRPEEESGREKWFVELRKLCSELQNSNQRLGIVVGGGLPAREAISLAKPFINDVHSLDEIGIAATRINATVIQQVLLQDGLDVATQIPHDCDAAANLLAQHHLVIMGGTTPGHTTDAVAVDFAIKSNANRCIIATNVSHVYDKDPRYNDDAQSFSELSLAELAEICGVGKARQAGQSAVVDPVAVEWAVQASLAMSVLDGRDINTLTAAIAGREFVGTNITK